MNLISNYIKKFFKNSEEANYEDELINGASFDYKTIPVAPVMQVRPLDTLHVTYTDLEGNEHNFKETVKISMKVNAFGVIRFKDAFGMKQGIGGVIGEIK